MNKLVKVALVAAVITALGAMSTAAHAAGPVALPAGDTIYQANYSDDPAALWTTASDGTATVIGTPATSGLSQVVDGAWNPSTGKSYVIGNGYDGPCELWEANLTTGQFTLIAAITGDEGDTYNCDAFDIAPDGTAWVSLYDSGTDGYLAQLNLTDGTTSAAVPFSGLGNGVTWIAIQPSTGVVFLGDWDNALYTVDTATGAATIVDSSSTYGASIYDAAFDSTGRLWLTGWPETTELLSADVANFGASLVVQGAILVGGDGDVTGTDSLWIVRGPAPAALASTGVDSSIVLAGGFSMLVLGFGAIALRRSRRA
ncbi:MAG: hypothetical protein ABL886_02330 [Rhodoglobus sp.]